MKLEEAWRRYDKFYVTTTQEVKEELERHGKVYVVSECNRQMPLRNLRVLASCIRIALKERPDVVISTGAAPACLFCIVARILGARIVWVDSIANIDDLSMSGRIIKPLADMMLVQWPEVAHKRKSVEYVGNLL
jgi:UDP-N-acetylglucosamine:LPS N-acetylglucosamine transferase